MKDVIAEATRLTGLIGSSINDISYDQCLKKIELFDTNTIKIPKKLPFAPFPYFGGKRRMCEVVWNFFGPTIDNYIEPFAGGMAMLLGRPNPMTVVQNKLVETVNDKDRLVVNAWRAMTYGNRSNLVDKVSMLNSQQHLDALKSSVNRDQIFLNRLIISNTTYYNEELAAYWIFGMRNAIGAGFANTSVGHRRVSPRVVISEWPLGSPEEYINYIKYRLTHVNLMNGDWLSCVDSRTRTIIRGKTAIFIDPPYPNQDRTSCYNEDDGSPSDEAADWAVEKIREDKSKKLLIAFCGYHKFYGKHFSKAGWTPYQWKAAGYGSQAHGQGRLNAEEECIWFSPLK